MVLFYDILGPYWFIYFSMTSITSTKKYYVIFDIDSSTIGGGVFEFSYNKKGEFVDLREHFSVRKNITNGKEYPFGDFFTRTTKIFREVADNLYRESRVSIDDVYINVGPPWMSAQKRSISYKKKTPFVLTQERADALIQKELEEQFSKNTDFKDHQVELIDRKTIDVHANGYPVRNPIGKTMSDVTMYSLTSVMSKDTKQSFQNIIEEVFHRQATMTSNTFINYEATRRFLPDTNNAIILDISGEISEISVIKHDHLEHLGTIPTGIHGIVRDLRDTLGISLEKAWGIIPLISGDHLTVEHRKNYERALDSSFTFYLKSLYNFLDTCSQTGLLPSTIILKTHKEFKYWFEEKLLQSDELTEVVTNRNIELVHLDTSIWPQYSEIGKDDELSVIAGYIGIYERANIDQR